MCRRSGYTTQRKNVTSSRGFKKGDLEIRDINLAGKRDFVIDVSLFHEFMGNSRRDDYRRNGNSATMILVCSCTTPLTLKCRSIARIIRPQTSTKLSFLTSYPRPAASMGEFLRLLYILALRQTVNFFDTLGEEPSNEAFAWRRAEYLFHNRAAIGIA